MTKGKRRRLIAKRRAENKRTRRAAYEHREWFRRRFNVTMEIEDGRVTHVTCERNRPRLVVG